MFEKKDVLAFVKNIISERRFIYYSTEYMRLSTMYWSANILSILHLDKDLHEIRTPILDFLYSCRNVDSGYGMSKGYPSTILSSFTVLQILHIFGELKYDEGVENYILSLFNEDGFFYGDSFGEEDTRLVCCAVLSLKLMSISKDSDCCNKLCLSEKISESYMEHLSSKGFSKNKVIEYILRCYNFDGGFGSSPGGESHTAQIFCCLGVLRSLDALNTFDTDKTIQFLVFRQNESGGFSGRPKKKEDVCYSFWNLASLEMLDGIRFIDSERLKVFIFSCQHESGGFSDRPENEPDLYHTMFALAGLSLIRCNGFKEIDAGFCL